MCESLRTDTCLTKDEEEEEEEKTMVCSAADLSGWGDFPKGLKVLLLDDDVTYAAEIKSKLEGMDYIVSLFSSEDEAIEHISNRTERFHVAIVEVNTCNSHEDFRFLEMAGGLPTVMISSASCSSTMTKCISLGAAEFLQKPLSDDEIRNVWQHAVHKGFNTLSRSQKPVNETGASMRRQQSDSGSPEDGIQINATVGTNVQDDDDDDTRKEGEDDRVLAAPSTPQLEQASRLLDECLSMEHEDGEMLKDSTELVSSSSETKLVDNTHEQEIPRMAPEETAVQDKKNESSVSDPVKKSSTSHRSSHPHTGTGSKKKSKVDWTPDLHRRFAQAVEQLGIDQAIPSKILELMKVEGLTRHNVASHLQKYRMHRRHVLPTDEERRWSHHRDSLSRVYAHKPIVAVPPAPSSFGYSTYPVWGHPNPNSYHPSSFQMWGHTASQTWYPSHGSWPWKSYTKLYADAWGCPGFFPRDPYSTGRTPHNFPQNHNLDVFENKSHIPKNLFDLHLGEEVIDEVVKEAISKPWLPLPLGLKPPSTDSVLAELNRQGIRSIPPPKCNR